MATITYTFVSRCAGGGHTTFDVSVNGGANRRIVYTTEDLRAPLSDLTPDQVADALLIVGKAHFAGKTRAQIVTELQAGPVTVTI